MNPSLHEARGLKIAVEGCGHGTLHAIYAAIQKSCEIRGWDGVDLVIIGGDFQAVRNASDLTVMSCPVKFREIGDFHAYYSGTSKAPFLTIFVGGNHEASSHLWELYYGGWVAPNIWYMGAAGVVKVGGLRIAGMSGIWKGYNYNKPHHERLPYNADDIKSIYHIRELDVRKLLQLSTQVDIGISHDWPRAIEKHGNQKELWRMKPDFEQESRDGTLGSVAAEYVMDRLRPPYWFAAHLHCKYSATKVYPERSHPAVEEISTPLSASVAQETSKDVSQPPSVPHNDDEIDLDMDDDDEDPVIPQLAQAGAESPAKEREGVDDNEAQAESTPSTSVPLEIRSQLPAAFFQPKTQRQVQQPEPPPPGISNKTVRFLALDKCLPKRKFLQLLEIEPHNAVVDNESISLDDTRARPRFEYDPEWLAITRVFANELELGDRNAQVYQNLGEKHYKSLIADEREWIEENVVKTGKLEIPENFVITAPVFQVGMPEIINEGPKEYDNPQMQQFCELVGIENKFMATEEERAERFQKGPQPTQDRGMGHGRGRGRGRGGARGGRGSGRGFARGRGRGW